MTETTGLRVSDAERSAVAERLLEAHGEGRLTLAEFDERVRLAHGATVRADLAPLTADLPGAAPRDRRPGAAVVAVPVRRRHVSGPCGGFGAGDDLRAAVAVWAAVAAVCVVVWAALLVGGVGGYPWWIWVAGPWGAMLALRTLARRLEPADPVATRPDARA